MKLKKVEPRTIKKTNSRREGGGRFEKKVGGNERGRKGARRRVG